MKQYDWKELEGVIAREYGNIAGIIVQQNDAICYERYFQGFDENDAAHMYSVTKSVISALIGIAIGKGLIKSIQQKVLEFFPDYDISQRSAKDSIRTVNIEHMLTMTAPYRYAEEPYEAFFTSEHWVNAALDQLGGDKAPGTFHYSAIIGTHILSGILEKATGQSVLQFARENLFAPLGVDILQSITFQSAEEQLAWYAKTKHKNSWVADRQGTNTASWGLCLRPKDLIKIGQLYLNDGQWAGKSIMSTTWVKESADKHSRWEKVGLNYGYLWWILGEGVYAAMGDGGNALYINKKKRLVVAIMGLFAPGVVIKDSIELITKHIEPMFEIE